MTRTDLTARMRDRPRSPVSDRSLPLAKAAVFCLAAGLLPSPADAQYGYFPDQPEAVEVADLSRRPSFFHEKAVLTRGKLGFSFGMNQRVMLLQDPESIEEILMAQPYMSSNDLAFMGAGEVEVEGWFFATRMVDEFTLRSHPILRNYPYDPSWSDSMDMRTEGFLAIVAVTPIRATEDLSSKREREAKAEMEIGDAIKIEAGSAAAIGIGELVDDPDPWMSHRVEVIGKFRGNNLFGDLSIKDKKTPRDFVIKTAEDAIWVTGMRPAGNGFRFDPKRRRDTGKWLRVFGRPWTSDGMVYLRAERIELADSPADESLEPVDIRVAEKEAREAEVSSPRVVFSLPLDGEREIALDSEFRVQFSNRMAADSFHAAVDLLYADEPYEENPFPDLELTYDDGSRSLLVVPNASLDPGREVHLILYREIEDEQGQHLEPHPLADEWDENAVWVLSFRTASP